MEVLSRARSKRSPVSGMKSEFPPPRRSRSRPTSPSSPLHQGCCAELHYTPMPRLRRSLRIAASRSLVLLVLAAVLLVATKDRFAPRLVPPDLATARSVLWVTAHRAPKLPSARPAQRTDPAHPPLRCSPSRPLLSNSRRRVLFLRAGHPQPPRPAAQRPGSPPLPVHRCVRLLEPSSCLERTLADAPPATGNHDGLGDTRRQELGASCAALGIARDRCTALDLPCVRPFSRSTRLLEALTHAIFPPAEHFPTTRRCGGRRRRWTRSCGATSRRGMSMRCVPLSSLSTTSRALTNAAHLTRSSRSTTTASRVMPTTARCPRHSGAFEPLARLDLSLLSS